MRRIALCVMAVITFSLGATGPAAADNDNDNDGVTVVDTFPVSFTITSEVCRYLPKKTTITGAGTEKSTTTTRTDDGVTTVSNVSVAHGTATDGSHQYVFSYFNRFHASDRGKPGTLSGVMHDVFSLTGNGPAHLHNGFTAGFTTSDNFGTVRWSVRHSFGDPISFASGPIVSHCDPI